MTKRKKTREQKIISQLRRKLQLSSSSPSANKITSNIPNTHLYSYTDTETKRTVQSQITKNNIKNITYTHLRKDLIKTSATTATIVVAELILLFLLKNNLITISKLTF